jgi:hypothetical protein
MNLRWPPFGAGLAWAGSAVIADVATTPAAATAEAALAKNERRPASGNEQQVQCVMERPSFLKSKAVPKYLVRVNKACAMRVKLPPVDLLLASRSSRGGGCVCIAAIGRTFMMTRRALVLTGAIGLAAAASRAALAAPRAKFADNTIRYNLVRDAGQ